MVATLRCCPDQEESGGEPAKSRSICRAKCPEESILSDQLRSPGWTRYPVLRVLLAFLCPSSPFQSNAMGWAEHGLWHQASIQTLTLPFADSVTLTMLFELSVPTCLAVGSKCLGRHFSIVNTDESLEHSINPYCLRPRYLTSPSPHFLFSPVGNRRTKLVRLW